MLLVVDVGNTQTHFGVYPDGAADVSEHWRFATVRESTRDELGAALSNLLGDSASAEAEHHLDEAAKTPAP